MDIQSIEILHLQLPLKFSFKTAKTLLSQRDTLIIMARDSKGLAGFGEVVAFTDPFYTAETLESALYILKSTYIPKILADTLQHPFDIHSIFDLSFPMALAGLENALLDLYAKQQGQNSIEMLFQEKLQEFTDVGIVLGDMPYEKLYDAVAEHTRNGCQRFKFKIFPNNGQDPYVKLEKIRNSFPHIRMLADANRSFSLNLSGVNDLKRYNALNLECVEEAFNVNGALLRSYSSEDFAKYAQALDPLNFNICHDESLLTLEDLHAAHENKVLQMVNIKIGRLGGLFYAQKIIHFCRKNNIPYFIGSMVESGISKILHVQLAALQGACMAGDLSDSKRYFAQDIIVPDITSQQGKIAVPSASGIGVNVDYAVLKTYTQKTWYFSR